MSTSATFNLPGSESEKAIGILQEKFPEAAGDSASIVVQAKDGNLSDPEVQAQIQEIVTGSTELPGVAGIVVPADILADPSALPANVQTLPADQGGAMQISEDGSIAIDHAAVYRKRDRD